MNNKYLNASMLAAALLWTVPAAASDTKPMTSEALILKPLILTKLSDLSFGSIIRSGSGDLVTINADTGARTSASALLVPSDPGYRARFASSGLDTAAVFLVVSPPGDLVNGAGNRLTVTNLSLDQGGNPVRILTPTSQVFFVGIGGQIFVRSNQEDGTYTGTFSLTAYYF